MAEQKLNKKPEVNKRNKFNIVISQIIEGYWKSIFKDPETEMRFRSRMANIESKCYCTKYYIDLRIFGKSIRFGAYCKYCGCILNSKARCLTCTCPKNLW